MASASKRPRSEEGGEAVEDDRGLAKLLHRRVGDVKELVTHIRKKEDEVWPLYLQRFMELDSWCRL